MDIRTGGAIVIDAGASEWTRVDALRRAMGSNRAPGTGLVLGIGDDTAILRPRPGMDLLVTQDALVEDVHFRRAWTRPEDLAHKLLAVSVSDVAAMGGIPRFALTALATPAGIDPAWTEAFSRGLAGAARSLRLRVVGGDTVRSPVGILADGVVLGEVENGTAVTRDGARPGDLLCLTGSIGGARAGLALAEGGVDPAALKPALAGRAGRRLLRPLPRVAAGRALRGCARALVDLSDGLAGAVEALRRAHPVGMRIEAARLPIDPAARAVARLRGVDPVAFALGGGEDYELLAAVPRRRLASLPRIAAGLHVIGEVTDGPDAVLVWPDGRAEPLPRGYDAFASSPRP